MKISQNFSRLVVKLVSSLLFIPFGRSRGYVELLVGASYIGVLDPDGLVRKALVIKCEPVGAEVKDIQRPGRDS